MLGKLILISMLVISLGAKENLNLVWKNMSTDERASIFKSYLSGKPYDLGLTLAAINWRESHGGRWQISTDHNDVGIYHINLYWYFKAMKIKDTIWNRSKYTTLLITKPKMSEIYVISKLQNLLLANNNNYRLTWKQYNGSGKKSDKYARDIRDRVIFLKKILIRK